MCLLAFKSTKILCVCLGVVGNGLCDDDHYHVNNKKAEEAEMTCAEKQCICLSAIRQVEVRCSIYMNLDGACSSAKKGGKYPGQ